MRIVLANGVFDLYHYGHLRHLQAARKLGDALYVSVTRDEFVRKGPGRPVFSLKQRMQVIAELRCVDKVFPSVDALDALRTAKPAVFVKGAEYRNSLNPGHIEYCRANGIEIAFTDEPVYSSTGLLKYYESRRG